MLTNTHRYLQALNKQIHSHKKLFHDVSSPFHLNILAFFFDSVIDSLSLPMTAARTFFFIMHLPRDISAPETWNGRLFFRQNMLCRVMYPFATQNYTYVKTNIPDLQHFFVVVSTPFIRCLVTQDFVCAQ